MKNPKWKRSKTHAKRSVRRKEVHVTVSHKENIGHDDTRSALRDVSKQRDVKKALHESEALYHTLFENTGTAMLVIHDDTTILAVNAELERISGYSKKELEGKRSWTEFVAKDCLEKMKEYHHLRRVDPKAAPRTYESKLINKQGNIIDALLTVSSIPGTRKSVVSFIDVTEHKKMEEELKRHSEHLNELVEDQTRELRGSESRLRLLTDAFPALISYVDSEQRYRFNNRAYEEWFQHSRTEITGQRINEVLGETAYQAIQRYVVEALTGKKVTYESTVPYKDGGQRYIYATYVPDFDEQGKVKGFYALVNDITERKQMEQTLQKVERYAAIGEAAAMVGHDLRNPLQVIINRLYLAKKVTRDLSYPYSDVAAKLGLDELFKELEDQIIYMNKIVSDLQDYSKPLKPELVETSLRQLIDNTFSMIQVPQNIQVSIEAFEHPKIMVDPGLMRRAFTNLIINAFQAMPSGGILTIRTSRTDDLAFISIRDTGVGIPRESIDRIFSPLYTTKAKGAGLGLPVCKRLIEAHNGNILVESQVGKGSTFTIKLPLTRGVN